MVFHCGAYSSFNLEIAPFLIIHDKLDGLYMLNFDAGTKTSILKH